MRKGITPKISIQGKVIGLRRWIYKNKVENVPQGFKVWNTCGDLRCINPKHMALSKNGRDLKKD